MAVVSRYVRLAEVSEVPLRLHGLKLVRMGSGGCCTGLQRQGQEGIRGNCSKD